MPIKKLCVMGLGYIGLPTASTFATHGLQVVGVDVNHKVLETLRAGGLHIHEPGLRTLVQAALGSGSLTLRETPESADGFIIAVPTPIYENKRADMRAVECAARAIAGVLKRGDLVVLESTSPPRTTVDLVAPILEESGLRAGIDFHLAYSPERVLPGQILRELIENARVIGGVDRASAQAASDLYAMFVRGEIIQTEATTAEMVKLMENTYRDVNIAIANEFSHLADRFGVDVWEAIGLANRHPRVDILRPGPGVGGHCISVDPWFLVEAAPELTPLIRTSRRVNDAQPEFIVSLVGRAVGRPSQDGLFDLRGITVAALGLAYKPDVDDLRESPALEVCRLLGKSGAKVKAFEPYKPGFISGEFEQTASIQDALSGADAAVVLVAHTQFKNLTPDQLSVGMPGRILVDTVGIWSPEKCEAAGFRLYPLGVGDRPVLFA